MKSYITKPAPSKLVAKFDKELINILTKDLKSFYTKNSNVYKVGQQQLLVA